MKITNVFGTEFTGTIGDMIIASNWKGRNYIKRYFIPSNPQSPKQTAVRNHFKNGVATWQGLAALQKLFYSWKMRYDKKQITAFNTLMAEYMEKVLAGVAYVPPTAGVIDVIDSITTNPIEGAKLIIRKNGQSTEYARLYSDVAGALSGGLGPEDENYDIFVTADGYDPYQDLDVAASALFGVHADIELVETV